MEYRIEKKRLQIFLYCIIGLSQLGQRKRIVEMDDLALWLLFFCLPEIFQRFAVPTFERQEAGQHVKAIEVVRAGGQSVSQLCFECCTLTQLLSHIHQTVKHR